jgi:hypothetical protein
MNTAAKNTLKPAGCTGSKPKPEKKFFAAARTLVGKKTSSSAGRR